MHQIDLIITDLNMPKLNGIDMIKKIKGIDKDIPIFITTAHNKLEYLLEGINLGVQGYFFKPLTDEQLLSTIKNYSEKATLKKYKDQILQLQTQYHEIMDQCSIVSKTDIHGVITYVNDEFCKISEYNRSELIGQRHNLVRCQDEPAETFRKLWTTIKNKKETWQGIIKNQTKNGEIYYVKSTIKPILNSEGEIQEFIALRTLVTDIIHPKKQLTDFLLSNSNAIVVLAKIENFKYIDTQLDEDISNQLQKEFATKLFNYLPSKYNFSKIYSLEKGVFAFAQKLDISNNKLNDLIHELKSFQQYINHQKINIAPISYDLSIIISIAYGEDAYANAKLGLNRLYSTKQGFIVANKLLKEKKNDALKTIATFNMVQAAINSYNIVSYFQPIINNKTKEIEKYESLVRMIDGEKNILSPYHFLNISKEGKYYQQITSIVLENSFSALYHTTKEISINLSALDIEKEETREHFFNLLIKNSKQAHRVVIELLEDEKINDIKSIKAFIKKSKSYGVKVAIDDFGEGYSNFNRVLEYEPDFIKIDAVLIKNIVHDDFSRHMVEAIVAFSKKQNIQTIAEYVENQEIFEMVCDLGVDYSQGYYFGKAQKLK